MDGSVAANIDALFEKEAELHSSLIKIEKRLVDIETALAQHGIERLDLSQPMSPRESRGK